MGVIEASGFIEVRGCRHIHQNSLTQRVPPVNAAVAANASARIGSRGCSSFAPPDCAAVDRALAAHALDAACGTPLRQAVAPLAANAVDALKTADLASLPPLRMLPIVAPRGCSRCQSIAPVQQVHSHNQMQESINQLPLPQCICPL